MVFHRVENYMNCIIDISFKHFFQYLYFDIQTIMGGRKIELGPDEVIFATTQLYVDIMGLYRYLLILIGVGTQSNS